MKLRSISMRVFNIQPGEGKPVLLLLALSFCNGLARLFTLTAAGTLFLVTYDVQMLPYVYIAVALVAPVLGMLYGRLEGRLPLIPLLSVNLGGMAIGLGFFWLNLTLTSARWPAFALAISSEIVWIMTSLALWGLAGRLLNVRQGKRLFGLIGVGDVVAATLGGLVSPALVNWFGTPSLIVGAIAALVAALGVSTYITRAFSEDMQDTTSETPAERTIVPSMEGQRRYVAHILMLAFVSTLSLYFIDNIFYGQVDARYTDELQLASFLGPFWAVVNVLTLIVNLGMVGPLLTRYGVRTGLLVLPVLSLVTTAVLVLSGVLLGLPLLIFWLAVLNNLFDWTFRETVYKSSLLVLYQPLPILQRFRVQTIVETVGQPLAQGVSGVALLGLRYAGFDVLGLNTVLLVLLTLSVVLSVPLGHRYATMILRALAKRRIGAGQPLLMDGLSIAVMRQAIVQPHPGPALYALEVLEEQAPAALLDTLRLALAHPAPQVRQAAITGIERHGYMAAVEDVRRHITDEPDAAVRGAAVRTLALLDRDAVLDWARPYFEHPDVSVRMGVIVGLLRGRNPGGRLIAEQQLYQLINSPAPADRSAGAYVLGEAGVRSYDQLLLNLLADSDRNVRRQAVEAAGKLRSPCLWPHVVAALADADTRSEAVAALVAGGDGVFSHLKAAFDNPVITREFAIRLLRIASRIGGGDVISFMQMQLASPDPGYRHQALSALVRLNFHASNGDEPDLRRHVAQEVAHIASLFAALHDLNDDATVGLLRTALLEEVERGRERIFLLLACMYDRTRVLHVQDNLKHPAAEKRAYACEALDMLVAHDVKTLVFPLVDDLTIEQRLQRLSHAFPQPHLGQSRRLLQIIMAPNESYTPWVRVCALYALAQDPTQDLTVLTSAMEVGQGQSPLGMIISSQNTVNPERHSMVAHGGAMFSLVEKVLILKNVSIFAGTPDRVLADVASLLEELELTAGAQLFAKGEPGHCMYIVVSGALRVHDGEQILDELGEHDIVGEMAVLDSAPRTASVTAIKETSLLRLDQDALYELMADQLEVARGIIKVLSSRLRDRVQDVRTLHNRLQEHVEQRSMV